VPVVTGNLFLVAGAGMHVLYNDRKFEILMYTTLLSSQTN